MVHSKAQNKWTETFPEEAQTLDNLRQTFKLS